MFLVQFKRDLILPNPFLFLLPVLLLIFSCEKDKGLFETLKEFEPLDNTETNVDSAESDLDPNSDDNEDVFIDTDETETIEKEFVYGDNVFYVAVNGSEGNDGKTENTPWSIGFAFNSAKAGDTIFIEAGNYGNVNLLVNHSGNAQEGIYFIGYKDFPLDTKTSGASSVSYEDYKNNGDILDSSILPTFMGRRDNDIGLGSAIRMFDKDYIHLENIQVQYYKSNIVNRGGKHCVFKNIITTDAGDFNLDHSDRDGNSGFNMTGQGLTIDDGDYNIIRDCLAINCGMRGVIVENGSDYTEHYDTKVYSDNNINATDYYYLISSNSSNALLENIYVERAKGMGHIAHGICLKDGANNNIVRNCTVVNTRIELSFDDVTDNLVEDSIILGRDEAVGCISIANGANHNVFRNVTVDGAAGGVKFEDWIDGDGDGASNAGHNNQFIDCNFSNMEYGVAFFFWDVLYTEAYENVFTNCSFSDMEALFQINRPNRANEFYSCSFSNIIDLSNSRSKNGLYPDFPLDAKFHNSITNNLGFELP